MRYNNNYFAKLKDLSLDDLATLSTTPKERLPKHSLLAKANGENPVGRPRPRRTNYIEDLG